VGKFAIVDFSGTGEISLVYWKVFIEQKRKEVMTEIPRTSTQSIDRFMP